MRGEEDATILLLDFHSKLLLLFIIIRSTECWELVWAGSARICGFIFFLERRLPGIAKIYESVIVEGIHILLACTQHVQYIVINFNKFAFQGTFNVYVKVDQKHFYRKQ